MALIERISWTFAPFNFITSNSFLIRCECIPHSLESLLQFISTISHAFFMSNLSILKWIINPFSVLLPVHFLLSKSSIQTHLACILHVLFRHQVWIHLTPSRLVAGCFLFSCDKELRTTQIHIILLKEKSKTDAIGFFIGTNRKFNFLVKINKILRPRFL